MSKIKEVDWKLELQKDIRKLMDKYGLDHGGFSAVKTSTDEQVGMIINKNTYNSFAQTVFAVGRLWQHCRSEMKNLLDSFDRWGGLK